MIQTKTIGRILASSSPQAQAKLVGSKKYNAIRGIVSFYDLRQAILIASSLSGIPTMGYPCGTRILGFHIHQGTSCSGTENDPFANAGMHYNPENCNHPLHAGDLPPLFVMNGMAWSCFLTTRFSIKDILGRTVILHAMPDDLHTQPSGNSGEKIACGVIEKTIQ